MTKEETAPRVKLPEPHGIPVPPENFVRLATLAHDYITCPPVWRERWRLLAGRVINEYARSPI